MPANMGQDQLTLIVLGICVVCATLWVLRSLRSTVPGSQWTANLADISDARLKDLEGGGSDNLQSNLHLAWLLTARGDYTKAAEVWERVIKASPENLRGVLVAQKTSFHCEESRDDYWTQEDGEWAVLYSTILHGQATAAQRRRFVVEATGHGELEEAERIATQLRAAAQQLEGHAIVSMRNGMRRKYSAVFDLSYCLSDALECVTENDGYVLLPFHRVKKLIVGPAVSCWVRAQLVQRGSTTSKYILLPLIYRGSLSHEDVGVRQGTTAVIDESAGEKLRHLGQKVLVGCNEGSEPQLMALTEIHSIEFSGPPHTEESWSFGDPLEAG